MIENINDMACPTDPKGRTWREIHGVPSTKHLMIFADTDRKAGGHAAAFQCAHKNLVAGVERVSVLWPERGDFNDVINNSIKVFKQEFKL